MIDDFDESTIRLRLKKEVELFWRKQEKKKEKNTGPAAQDMIVLMRRLLYLSFSSLPTV